MQFSVIALALAAASFVSAQNLTTSVVYSTDLITITSCAATVTNCPAHPELATEERIITSVVVAYTTVCPISLTSAAEVVSTAAPGSVIVTESCHECEEATATAPAKVIVTSEEATTAPATLSTVVTKSCHECEEEATSTAVYVATTPASGAKTVASIGLVKTPTTAAAALFTGAAPKLAGSVGGVIALAAAAFAL